MAIWNRCAICGRAIQVGELLCYEVKNWRGDPIGVDTICRDCLVPENAPTLTPPNEPLTLEQLREMNGEPVFVPLIDCHNKIKIWGEIHVDNSEPKRPPEGEKNETIFGIP